MDNTAKMPVGIQLADEFKALQDVLGGSRSIKASVIKPLERRMMNDLHIGFCELECIDRRSGVDRRAADNHLLIATDKRSCIDRRSGLVRRSTQRFQVKNFIFVKLWSEQVEDIGQLLEISSRGLSFRYMSDNEKLGSFSELSIITNNTIVISKIPFKTISDIELGNGSPTLPIIFIRSGVQFRQLLPRQQLQLEQFLNHHAEVSKA